MFKIVFVPFVSTMIWGVPFDNRIFAGQTLASSLISKGVPI